MKRISILFTVAFLAAALSGCAPDKPQAATKNADSTPLPYKEVDVKSLPREAQELVEGAKKTRGFNTYNSKNHPVVVIHAGEKGTSGWQLSILSVERKDNITEILVRDSKPVMDKTDAKSIPFKVLEIDGLTDTVLVKDENGKLLDKVIFQPASIHGEGLFVGVEDGKSVTIKVGDSYIMYLLPDSMKPMFALPNTPPVQKDDKVHFHYTEKKIDENTTQFELVSIEKDIL